MNPHNTTHPTPQVKSYLFRMDEIFYLTPTVRSFLLESICLRLDMRSYARYALKLVMEEDGQGSLRGRCLFCTKDASLLLNKRNGEYACPACGKSGDLFSLTNTCSVHPSTVMNDAAIYMSAYIAVEAERKGQEEGAC